MDVMKKMGVANEKKQSWSVRWQTAYTPFYLLKIPVACDGRVFGNFSLLRIRNKHNEFLILRNPFKEASYCRS